MTQSNHYCEMCKEDHLFVGSGTIKIGKGRDLSLNTIRCTTCEKFAIIFLEEKFTLRSFLVSKVYDHEFICIVVVNDPLTKIVEEIKVYKKDNGSTNLSLNPKEMPFELDPTHPNEDMLLSKLQIYEIFS